MEEYWEKKVAKVIEISNKYGYEELDKEFWRSKPAILISFVVDMYKSKEKTIKTIEKRLEEILKEEEE